MRGGNTSALVVTRQGGSYMRQFLVSFRTWVFTRIWFQNYSISSSFVNVRLLAASWILERINRPVVRPISVLRSFSLSMAGSVIIDCCCDYRELTPRSFPEKKNLASLMWPYIGRLLGYHWGSPLILSLEHIKELQPFSWLLLWCWLLRRWVETVSPMYSHVFWDQIIMPMGHNLVYAGVFMLCLARTNIACRLFLLLVATCKFANTVIVIRPYQNVSGFKTVNSDDLNSERRSKLISLIHCTLHTSPMHWPIQ